VKQLGPYAIEAELGRGGMGVVYRARDTRDGRVVALKALLPGSVDAELLARFQREATALRGVRHANLVEVLDVQLAPPRPYAVFDYVPGETLQARVAREGPLPWPQALGVANEVASGLSAAHERGLLHRDVKPANVLLGPQGAKLADFGLVKELGRDSLTQTGATLGTVGYLAPEQIGSDKERQGPATDVYGLAATLYFALTGRPPFSGASVVSTLSAVASDPPLSPRALAPAVPAWLEGVCLRGLAKQPGDRYRNAVVFRAALQHGAPAGGGSSRARVALATSAALAALALAGGLAYGVGASAPPADLSVDPDYVEPPQAHELASLDEVYPRLERMQPADAVQLVELLHLADRGFQLVEALPEELRPADRVRLTRELTTRLRGVEPDAFAEHGWLRIHELLLGELDRLPWRAVREHLLTLDALEPGAIPGEGLVAWGDRVEHELQYETLGLESMLPLARLRLRQDPVDAEGASKWIRQFARSTTRSRERVAAGVVAHAGKLDRVAIEVLVRAVNADPGLYGDPEVWALLRDAHLAVGEIEAWLGNQEALQRARPELPQAFREEVVVLTRLRRWTLAESRLAALEQRFPEAPSVTLREEIQRGRAADLGDLDLARELPGVGPQADALVQRSDFAGLERLLRDALPSLVGHRDLAQALIRRAQFELEISRGPLASEGQVLVTEFGRETPDWTRLRALLARSLSTAQALPDLEERELTAQALYGLVRMALEREGALRDPGAVALLRTVLEEGPQPEPRHVRALGRLLIRGDVTGAVPGSLCARLADLSEAALRPELRCYPTTLRLLAELRLLQQPPAAHAALGTLRTLAQLRGLPAPSPVREQAAALAEAAGQRGLAERLRRGLRWTPLPTVEPPPRGE